MLVWRPLKICIYNMYVKRAATTHMQYDLVRRDSEKCLCFINEMGKDGGPVTADFAILSCAAGGHVHTIAATR